MGVLYLVATPIGNLEDITLRALRVLRQVKLIAAEDTRTTAKLLNRYEIRAPMVSFFEHNELVRQDQILQALDSGDVALVSEAGTPAVSDPGYRLVQAAIASNVSVVAIPGPSAVLAALSVSGLPTDSFLFLGFLPRRRAARQRLLASVARHPHTLICFEAPHRLLAALEDIHNVCGDRRVAVANDLTKMYEQVWRGRVGQALVHFREARARGEFTLVIEAAPDEAEPAWDSAQVRATLAGLIATGTSRRDAVDQVAELARWPRRQVYRLSLEESAAEQLEGGVDGRPG
jgi:16S rRNA (cytidine1402-2'-O)-methyltransferase